MFITPVEIFRLIVVTLALGYIFLDTVKGPKALVDFYKKYDWQDIKISMIIAAPAVLLHELGHKFAAIFYGLSAEFFASYFGLGLGVLLKLVGSPFLVFIPGYVSINNATITQSAIIAFMGPLMNLFLWISSYLLLKYKHFNNKTMIILYATKRINMILFFFNMIPIPPFDGAKVLSGLLKFV